MFLFMFVLWVISAIALAIEFNIVWAVVFIITLIYLFVKGVIFIGFDLEDLFD